MKNASLVVRCDFLICYAPLFRLLRVFYDVDFFESACRAPISEAGSRAMSELTPKHVLADLFGSGDFPAEILDPAHAADVVIERLLDAGFEIKPAGN